MNRIGQKLRSRTGASITFALLIFLVCTVLSSVIITAATTAAGRMSQTAEDDRQYYAVTSASKLLSDRLAGGKTVSVVQKKESTVTITYAADGSSSAGEPVSVPKETRYVEKADAKPVTSADLSGAPITPNTFATDAANKVITANGSAVGPIELSLTVNDSSHPDVSADLGVTVTETIDKMGNIILTVSRETDKGYTFSQRLTFTVSITTGGWTDPKVISSPVSTGDGGYTVTETTTSYDVTSYRWTLTGTEPLKTQRAPSGG